MRAAEPVLVVDLFPLERYELVDDPTAKARGLLARQVEPVGTTARGHF